LECTSGYYAEVGADLRALTTQTCIDFWQILQFEGLRVRFVEYSKAHIVDYWCEKGHVVYCLEGDVINELKDGFLEVC